MTPATEKHEAMDDLFGRAQSGTEHFGPRNFLLAVMQPLPASSINTPLTFDSMLALMTKNVGYILSIFGGTFVGSLVIGRYDSGAHLETTLHG